MALKFHPDKQKDKSGTRFEAAIERFEGIKKAYEVLLDEKERKAFDSKFLAKRALFERSKKLDAKTRRLAEDLNRREQAFQTKKIEIERTKKRRRLLVQHALQQDKEFLLRYVEHKEEKLRQRQQLSRQSTAEQGLRMGGSSASNTVIQMKLSWSSKKHQFTEDMLTSLVEGIMAQQLSSKKAEKQRVQKKNEFSLSITGKKENRAKVEFQDELACLKTYKALKEAQRANVDKAMPIDKIKIELVEEEKEAGRGDPNISSAISIESLKQLEVYEKVILGAKVKM